MKTLKQLAAINTFVHEITATTSTKAKQQILSKYRDDETIRSFLYFLLNPYIVSGIGRKKVEKPLPEKSKEANSLLTDFLSLLSWIEVHNTGDYAAVKKVRQFADKYPEYKDLIFDTITKSLRIGCDSKTINSVMPNLIPQFSCMLAQKYFEKPEKLSGKTFAITTKLDGFRLIALKDKFGNIKFYSRVGQLVEGLVEIEAELKANFPNDVALDGELTISNYFDMPSKDAYKAASKIIRLKGDTPKTGLTYRVFDMMTAEEFISQRCPAIYDARRSLLDSYAGRASHIEVLPVLYRGNDTSKITEFLDKITSEGGEGCILNLCDAPYVWNRTWNLQKVKKFDSLDLEVVDIEEGSGRLAGTLGAIHVRYKDDNIVKVGSGFSDEERKLYFNNPALILHRIVEIKFFEESTNADGTYSLRFPTWCSNIRDSRDKATPDF